MTEAMRLILSLFHCKECGGPFENVKGQAVRCGKCETLVPVEDLPARAKLAVPPPASSPVDLEGHAEDCAIAVNARHGCTCRPQGLAPARECWVPHYGGDLQWHLACKFKPTPTPGVEWVRMVPAPVSPSLEAPKAMDGLDAWQSLLVDVASYIQSKEDTRNYSAITDGHRLYSRVLERVAYLTDKIHTRDHHAAPAPAVQGARFLPTTEEGNRVVDGLLRDQYDKERAAVQGAPTEADNLVPCGNHWPEDDETCPTCQAAIAWEKRFDERMAKAGEGGEKKPTPEAGPSRGLRECVEEFLALGKARIPGGVNWKTLPIKVSRGWWNKWAAKAEDALSAPEPEAGGAQDGDLDLEAIEARANAAKRGPWTRGRTMREGEEKVYPLSYSTQVEIYPPMGEVGPVCSVGDEATAEFLYRVRQDVPALIAEVRRLRSLPLSEAPASSPLDLEAAEQCAELIRDFHAIHRPLAFKALEEIRTARSRLRGDNAPGGAHLSAKELAAKHRIKTRSDSREVDYLTGKRIDEEPAQPAPGGAASTMTYFQPVQEGRLRCKNCERFYSDHVPACPAAVQPAPGAKTRGWCEPCKTAGRLASDGLYCNPEKFNEARRVCACRGSGDGVHEPAPGGQGAIPSEAGLARNVLETYCESLGLRKGMPLWDLAACVTDRLANPPPPLVSEGPKVMGNPLPPCECPCGCKRPADSRVTGKGPIGYNECDWCDSCMHAQDKTVHKAPPAAPHQGQEGGA